MKLGKPAQKAYGINWEKIDEGAYYSGNINPVYAESLGKAKTKLLPDISEYELRWSDESITYINAPVVRVKELDKYLLSGKLLTIQEYENELVKIERLNKLESILSNDNITHCHIIKRGLYYADGSCGYTNRESIAGIYDKTDAIQQAKSCDELDISPLNKKKHNELINNEIKNLKARLIK